MHPVELELRDTLRRDCFCGKSGGAALETGSKLDANGPPPQRQGQPSAHFCEQRRLRPSGVAEFLASSRQYTFSVLNLKVV